MGKYIGYIIIFGIFFFFKWSRLQSLEKTKGVVVDGRLFSYGSAFRPGRQRDVVPYPIAQFHGPTSLQEKITYIRRPEDIAEDEFHFDSSLHGEALAYAIKDSIRRVQKQNTIVEQVKVTEYRTQEPTGAYFFTTYNLGDSIDVIYENGRVMEARVYTFFSYWITLPSLGILIMLSLIWTGIYNLVTKKYA